MKPGKPPLTPPYERGELNSELKPLLDYVRAVASHFDAHLGSSLAEAYQLGSLAHGGFSSMYSDIDVALVLSCDEPPAGMEASIADAKKVHPEYGKKLSVFWGNPAFRWGRLPVLDRLDLLDHGLPLIRNYKVECPRPTREEIENALLDSVEKSWRLRINELNHLTTLEPSQRKPYIRAVLYPARLIYSWDFLAVDSNDRAVDYLLKIKPRRLDLGAIALALDCRHGRCSAEDVFALKADLAKQFDSTMQYIAKARNSGK